MMTRPYTDKQMKTAYKKAKNLSDFARLLGLKKFNPHLKILMEKLNLSYDKLSDKGKYTVKYTKEIIQNAVTNSTSYSAALRYLKQEPVGSQIRLLQRRIKKYNIDTSHFKPWNKGPRKNPSEYKTDAAFKKYIKNKRNNTCEKCGINTWQGHIIHVEVHHLDGDRTNNDETNLECLCPNCHSITPNYRNRKRKTMIPTGNAPV